MKRSKVPISARWIITGTCSGLSAPVLASPNRAVLATLAAAGLRGELDERSESVARKIRDAELLKIPYMLVVGEREASDGTVSVRERGVGDSGAVPVAEFVARLAAETTARSR